MSRGTNLLGKIGWTLLAGLLSFSVTGLFEKALDVSVAEQLIVTILIGGVTLLVQYLADLERRSHETDRLRGEEIRNLRGFIQHGFESVDEATELMTEIDQSAGRRELLKQVIRRSGHITPAAPPLVQFLAESEMRRLAETLQALSDGHELFYDGEDREYLLALTRGTTGSLLAVSWATVNADKVSFEAGFWFSDLGARYLDLQRAAARRGVTIRRIFIIESPTLMTNPELRRILAMQRNAGISVRVSSDSEAAQDGGFSDFVIFDEQICYVTTPVTRQEAPGAPARLTTRLVLNQEFTRHRIERFEELWANPLPSVQLDLGDDGPAVIAGSEPLGPS
ncbi:hypothetical protein JIG36_30185 [Actinoplanes sp. LDG1-06]|uniref:DUF6879 domain-containing protein n=1 Tax=Paractinoplanes ovalisporus TaxID=2810368 RepID=A0ABS2AIV2_9ACTN|nr:hypothetical protein [Actinoplanes ovalisporus]MBM2619787.1 hypothetical protein [Actinoplanes ovalisporus]